jgi:DNA-binding MarR family transcriptional regulator
MRKRDDLMYEFEKTLQHKIRSLRKKINEILGEEVNRSEFILLRYLRENGTTKVSTISNELKVTSSHITSVADSLVNKSLITRDRSVEDRRVVEIGLTNQGKSKIEELEYKKSQYLFSTFDQLSDDEIQELIFLFNKIDA